MPIEATMIIIDNSEYMRNGDYQPSRFHAQSDAANTIFQTKIDSNPENSVGLMTMAGKGPEVLVTNTKDLGQVLQAIHTASGKVGGSTDIPTAIAVAQLALKHRQNKNLRQRIIAFVGSPLEGLAADERNMIKLAKKLKKNNVAVDVIAFGDGVEEGEQSVLKTFVDNANSGDNSHYVAIPPGALLLSDVLVSSAILAGDRGIPEELAGNPEAAAPAGGSFEFGVDPSLDPELAMALRMSMEEETARQAAAAAASAPAGEASGAKPAAAYPPDEADDDDEEALLKKALAMSQGEDVDMEADGEGEDDDEDEDMSEEDAIARAIQMSMKDGSGDSNEPKKS
ncbi:hypothetical protein EUX98_g2016 [Antrodiella citrinella]|uniref:VWFA domain-containing protein n=1 Tax=Antrodiella citrinella TaxID=2447956 RepID=A0A4S4N2C3_9APHY|nr:hypothetical protein EUX98_g2016 [Antrodiella citrinella]